MFQRRTLFGLAFLASASAFAEDDQRLYRSAYYLGRGDTGISVADDQEAIMYNPAGVAQGKGIYKRVILASPMVEASDDARNLARELSTEGADAATTLRKRVGTNEHVGAYNLTAVVLRRAAIGVLANGTTDILIYKSPKNGGLESVDAKAIETLGPTFSLANGFFGDSLYLGTTLKYLQRGEAKLSANVTDADAVKNLKASDLYGTGTGLSTDFGLMWKGGGHINPSFGAVMRNAGGTKFKASSATAPTPDPLVQVVDVGAAIEPGTKFSKFRLLAEYWDITNALSKDTYKKTHFGAELSVRDMFGVTGGMAQGWSSAGMYIDLYVVRLDGGVYIQEMADRAGIRPDKRLFLRLAAGF